MITATLNHIKDFHHWGGTHSAKANGGIPWANVVPNPETDGYIGACRSGGAFIYPPDTVDVLTYDKDLRGPLSREHATEGEDPRAFTFNDRPYALTWSPNKELIFSYKLIDLLDVKTTILDIENFGKEPGELPVLGKNWMPLVNPGQRGTDLYIVVTLDPIISVLRCDVNTGYCSWVTPLDRVQNGIYVSRSRGGSPLIYNEANDVYVGFGHRTYDAYNHKPFLYTLTKDFSESTVGEDIITGKKLVEDPQSIFIEDGKIYCCIGNQAAHWIAQGVIDESGAVGLYEVILATN